MLLAVRTRTNPSCLCVSRRCREVAGPSARLKVRSANTYRDSTPRAIRTRIVGEISDYVLIRELVRDLGIHVGQLRRTLGHEQPTARFLSELPEAELSI